MANADISLERSTTPPPRRMASDGWMISIQRFRRRSMRLPQVWMALRGGPGVFGGQYSDGNSTGTRLLSFWVMT